MARQTDKSRNSQPPISVAAAAAKSQVGSPITYMYTNMQRETRLHTQDLINISAFSAGSYDSVVVRRNHRWLSKWDLILPQPIQAHTDTHRQGRPSASANDSKAEKAWWLKKETHRKSVWVDGKLGSFKSGLKEVGGRLTAIQTETGLFIF